MSNTDRAEIPQVPLDRVVDYLCLHGWNVIPTETEDPTVFRKCGSNPAELRLPKTLMTKEHQQAFALALSELARTEGRPLTQTLSAIQNCSVKRKRRESLLLRFVSCFFTGLPPYEPNQLAAGLPQHAYYYKSFVLSAQHIRAMFSLLSRGPLIDGEYQEGKPTIEVRTLRDSNDFMNVEELVSHLNPRRNRITSLKITAGASSGSWGGLVHFQDFPQGWTCAALAEGPPCLALERFHNELVDAAADSFQWYSWLSNNRFWYSFWTLVLLTCLVVMAFSVYQAATSTHPLGLVTEANRMTGEVTTRPAEFREIAEHEVRSAVAVWPYEIAVAVLMFVVRPYLFPKGVFLIGQEQERYKAIQRLRWAALTAVVAPVLLAIGRWLFT